MRAGVLRAVAFLVPLGVSVLAGLAMSSVLPRPESLGRWGLWWLLVLGASTAGLVGADRLARRLLPLATLMRLSMLFPDHAPSRIKVARNVAGSRAIVAELQQHGHAGVAGDRQQAAETILALVGALGDYDSRTRGHSERTQLFVTLLADELKLNKEDRGRLMWAALVHDIGKLKVPHEVLNKAGKPTLEEWEVLQSHPHQGAVICDPLKQWLGEWWYAIEQHHERYDGGGYPRGLAGSDISYGARIVAVADSYEVMTGSRPYKRPMTAQAAREELTRHAGTQFDPDVVRAFLNISLGRMHRASGPLAWLIQFLAVRPGPIGSQILGGVVSAAGATAAVLGLQIGATADDAPASRDRPVAAAPDVTAPSVGPTGPPADRPQAPRSTPPSSPTPAPRPLALPSPFTLPTPTPSPAPAAPVTSAPPPVDDPFASTPDRASTDEDVAVMIDVLANDKDTSGHILEVGEPEHGSAVVADGRVRYRPTADFHGADSFTYRSSDTDGAEATTSVDVRVRPVNDRPVASAASLVVDEDGADVETDLLAGSADVDGDALTVASLPEPDHGRVADRGDGHVTYTPEPDFSGTDTATFTLTDGHGGKVTETFSVLVLPVPDAPRSTPDQAWTTEDSQGVRLNLQDNDVDADGDALGVSAVTGAAHGSVVPEQDGTWTYRPDPDFAGVEQLTYTVVDPTGRSDTGIAAVTVVEVNDPPTARDDTLGVDEDAPATAVDVLANDDSAPDTGETLHVVPGSVSDPAHGTAVMGTGGQAGSVLYTPDADFVGTDAFTYDVADGRGGRVTATVHVAVATVNDPPVALDDAVSLSEDGSVAVDVLANDSAGPDTGETLSVAAGSVTAPGHGTAAPGTGAQTGRIVYTPDPDFAGTDSFDYAVSDGNGGTDTATVSVTVDEVNDLPVAVDDSTTVLEDGGTLSVAVLANDSDVDADALTLVPGSVSGSTLGVARAGTGTDADRILYTPDPDVVGQDVVSYTVSDGRGGTATASLTIDVTPVNDPPVAGPDAFATTTLIGTLDVLAVDGVLANDTDIDGDPITVTGDDSTAVTIWPDGSISYLVPLFDTTEVVTYTVSDGTTTSTGRLTITVSTVPPVTTSLYLHAPADTAATGTASTTRPSPTTPIVDVDGDGHPGLTVRSSGMKPDESDVEKFQEWEYLVPSDLTLNGPVALRLWTSLEDKAGEDLDYAAWVYDCVAGSCTLLTGTADIHVDDWSTTATWEQRSVTVGSVKATVPAGHTVRVRVAFNHSDVWLPLGSGMDASLDLTS